MPVTTTVDALAAMQIPAAQRTPEQRAVFGGPLKGPPQKRPVASFTPAEQEHLKAQGLIDPAGFVDMKPPPQPEMKADPRQAQVAAQLRAATEGPAVAPAVKAEAPGVPTADAKELENLKKKLADRLHCPRCGIHFDEHFEHQVSSADTNAFLKSVLGGFAFEKTYDLFGGHLKVVLRTRSGPVEAHLREAMMSQSGTFRSEAHVFNVLKTYTLAASLKSYGSREYSEPTGATTELFVAECKKRVNEIPAQAQAFLIPILEDFGKLVTTLTARAQDPSFWTGMAP
jgi:hypothetical protein